MNSDLHIALNTLYEIVTDTVGSLEPEHSRNLPEFPSEKIERALQEGTYENLQSAIDNIFAWGDEITDEMINAHFSHVHHDLLEAFDVIQIHSNVLTTIMPEYLLEEGGLMRPIPHTMPTPEGAVRLHSAGNAVLYHGVQASVFARPLQSLDVYDGTEALNAGSVKDLEPVGKRSDYRIAIMDGEVQIPPIWPQDAMRKQSAQCENDLEPEF